MLPIATTVATRYAPFATWLLIAANSLVFLYQVTLPDEYGKAFIYSFGLIPMRFFYPAQALAEGLGEGSWLHFLTNTFLHGGWLHIILNMWTLAIFGPSVEDRLGSVRFMLFYLLCGIGASIAHAWFNPASPLPALGASGAIAGVLGAYSRLFPFSRIVVMIPVLIFPFFFEMYAAIYTAIWFILQLVQGIGGLFAQSVKLTGGIAWWAHIGGFVAGWLLIALVRLKPTRYRNYYGDEGIMGFLPDGRRNGQGPWR